MDPGKGARHQSRIIPITALIPTVAPSGATIVVDIPSRASISTTALVVPNSANFALTDLIFGTFEPANYRSFLKFHSTKGTMMSVGIFASILFRVFEGVRVAAVRLR